MSQRLFTRTLDLPRALAKNSWFLLGPRMTGKSTLIRETLPNAVVFDLLVGTDFQDLIVDPTRIEQAIDANTDIVVIDEIQKAPQLLDEVHRLIESTGVKFLLTGSSARKLRRSGVNLLGGRAGTLHFHPLLLREIGTGFNLTRALRYGTLPAVYLNDEPNRALKNYVGTYLREEIAAEGFARDLPSFIRFLDIAAHCNATIVNSVALASDAQVPRTTITGYFEILKDTMIIHELPAWRGANVRKLAASSKYYFFDIGVATAIQARTALRSRSTDGFAFETWLFHELQSWIDYCDRDELLSHWRTQSGLEVDFLIGEHTAIELKAKNPVGQRDLRSLQALMREQIFQNYLCVCLEPRPRRVEGIEILPYQVFLDNLWQGAYE